MSQEIVITSLDSGGWSGFFFISVFVGLIHHFTAQTSSAEEVDSRGLWVCLSGVFRSMTQRRVSDKQAIDVVSISYFCLPYARQLFLFHVQKGGVGYSAGVKEVFMRTIIVDRLVTH
jgi:hypothetical protein